MLGLTLQPLYAGENFVCPLSRRLIGPRGGLVIFGEEQTVVPHCPAPSLVTVVTALPQLLYSLRRVP